MYVVECFIETTLKHAYSKSLRIHQEMSLIAIFKIKSSIIVFRQVKNKMQMIGFFRISCTF